MTGNNKKRGLVVQSRDRRLFEELPVMRVVDREQAKIVAGFGSTTRANARLLALVRAGLLRRFFLGAGNPCMRFRKKVRGSSECRCGVLVAGRMKCSSRISSSSTSWRSTTSTAR